MKNYLDKRVQLKEEEDEQARVFTFEFEEVLFEKNVPTNPSLWSRAKSEAKKRFDVYPSAYANGWAAKWYKERGGRWRTKKTESNTPHDREWGTDSLVKIYKQDTPGQMDEFFGIHYQEVDSDLVRDYKRSTPGQTNEAKQGRHVVLLAVPKNPNDGDGKGYWKIGSEVYRGPVKNVQFDTTGAPMDKRWESSFAHFSRYFDAVYGKFYEKAATWTSNLKEAAPSSSTINTSEVVTIIFESLL